MELSVLEQCSSKVIGKSMYIYNISKVEVPSAVVSTLLSVGYIQLELYVKEKREQRLSRSVYTVDV